VFKPDIRCVCCFMSEVSENQGMRASLVEGEDSFVGCRLWLLLGSGWTARDGAKAAFPESKSGNCGRNEVRRGREI
jgi:hypothetical protein